MISELVYRIIFSVGWCIFLGNLVFVTIRTGVLPNTHGQHVRWRYVLIYAPMGIIWYFGVIAYAFFPGWIAFTSLSLPDWVRLLCGSVAYCGLVFGLWGYVAIGRNWGRGASGVRNDVNTLVTAGPYAIVRNPIYDGIMVFLVCIGVTAANILTVIPSLVLCAFVVTTVPGEERALIVKFGQTYLDYMERVPRFIPKVHKH